MATNRMWDEFCDQLKEAGQALLDDQAPQDPLNQAEGVRYLLRLLRYATLNNIENADPRFPTITNALDPNLRCKIGADNPDNIYLRAPLSAEYRYRIHGTRGTAPLLTLGSKANRYHIDGTMASTGELANDEITVDDEGRFSVIASAEPPPDGGDWLPLTEATTNLTGRQSFQDRSAEIPARVEIELLDDVPAPEPLDPGTFARQLAQAVQFVKGTSATFTRWTRMFSERPNELPDWGQDLFQGAGGDPAIFYLHGYWRIAADEAWVIRTRVPECEYWNFVLQNWWMESLDHDRMNTYVNNRSARLDEDGTVTIVVADRDPGFGNWLTTGGHREGTALLRWVGATDHPLPTCTVVKV
ncbi:DUF1214 domain-containing protein [Nocardioides albidus]|uniref:DUF1214 domain-containing protein n=1 Tax=Nocardioides albidus TaxID=1517589 RepID=A0A5C4WTD3_9ACTN|nr:DUF1214 domain-containing protein [Nocardioides albidus]TNM50845.1 DUF1214 domain-containing protein [Nocardioides albidus]